MPVHSAVSSIHFESDLPVDIPVVILLSNSKPCQLCKELLLQKPKTPGCGPAIRLIVSIARRRPKLKKQPMPKARTPLLPTYFANIMKLCSRATQSIFFIAIMARGVSIARKIETGGNLIYIVRGFGLSYFFFECRLYNHEWPGVHPHPVRKITQSSPALNISLDQSKCKYSYLFQKLYSYFYFKSQS